MNGCALNKMCKCVFSTQSMNGCDFNKNGKNVNTHICLFRGIRHKPSTYPTHPLPPFQSKLLQILYHSTSLCPCP